MTYVAARITRETRLTMLALSTYWFYCSTGNFTIVKSPLTSTTTCLDQDRQVCSHTSQRWLHWPMVHTARQSGQLSTQCQPHCSRRLQGDSQIHTVRMEPRVKYWLIKAYMYTDYGKVLATSGAHVSAYVTVHGKIGIWHKFQFWEKQLHLWTLCSYTADRLF